MNAALLLRVIEDGLRPVVQAAGGCLDVASDPDHVLELLTAAQPSGWRVVIAYAGESSVGGVDARGIRELEITATVQAARGLSVRRGDDAHRPTRANRDSLLDLSNQVDLWIRGFGGTTYGDIDSQFIFVSRQWLEIEGYPLRQIMTTHSIRIGNDLVEPSDIIALTFPPIS